MPRVILISFGSTVVPLSLPVGVLHEGEVIYTYSCGYWNVEKGLWLSQLMIQALLDLQLKVDFIPQAQLESQL